MKPINGFPAIGGLRRLVTTRLQDRASGLAYVPIVFHDEDPWGRNLPARLACEARQL